MSNLRSYLRPKTPIPQNEPGREDDHDLLLRYLDCAVINSCHELRSQEDMLPFDTVRGVFFEGGSLFEKKDTHEIAARNTSRILGYFWPRYPKSDQ